VSGAGFTPVVLLLAVAGLAALPYDLAVNDGGGLDFAWRPSQTREDVLADPVVRVTVRRGSSPDGVGWIVGTCVEVTGDDAHRARWCEERNAALRDVASGPAADPGWAPTSTGNCRVTARFTLGDLAGHIDVLGTWNRAGDTVTYSVLVPPTMAVWAWPAMATEMLAWLGRHTVRQIQSVVLRAPLHQPAAAAHGLTVTFLEDKILFVGRKSAATAIGP
jgi:hypothetical protein